MIRKHVLEYIRDQIELGSDIETFAFINAIVDIYTGTVGPVGCHCLSWVCRQLVKSSLATITEQKA